MIRDDEIYPIFRDAVESVEPLLLTAIERIRTEVDAATSDRLSDAVRQVFGRVLNELADLENPMRTLIGDQPGDGDGTAPAPAPHLAAAIRPQGTGRAPTAPARRLLVSTTSSRVPIGRRRPARRDRRAGAATATCPRSGPTTSRVISAAALTDADSAAVLYNDQHADFLFVKDDDPALLGYLATLVATEYVVYNNPCAAADELGEELVRMLVRVRRHLPQRGGDGESSDAFTDTSDPGRLTSTSSGWRPPRTAHRAVVAAVRLVG